MIMLTIIWIMLSKNYSLNLKLSTKVLVLTLATISVMTLGITPEINWQTKTININPQVLAGTPSDDILQKYVKAAKEIESLRKSTLSQIAAKIGQDQANQIQLASCNSSNISKIKDQAARNLAEKYCNKSEEIVKKHGLSINKFNQITQQRKQDPSLNQRIQNMI